MRFMVVGLVALVLAMAALAPTAQASPPNLPDLPNIPNLPHIPKTGNQAVDQLLKQVRADLQDQLDGVEEGLASEAKNAPAPTTLKCVETSSHVGDPLQPSEPSVDIKEYDNGDMEIFLRAAHMEFVVRVKPSCLDDVSNLVPGQPDG